jgi:hypothetical protein
MSDTDLTALLVMFSRLGHRGFGSFPKQRLTQIPVGDGQLAVPSGVGAIGQDKRFGDLQILSPVLDSFSTLPVREHFGHLSEKIIDDKCAVSV